MGGNDLNMAFYGESSVRVRTHAHYSTLSTETRTHTEHMAQSIQVNQSIRKDQGRPSQDCRGGLVG